MYSDFLVMAWLWVLGRRMLAHASLTPSSFNQAIEDKDKNLNPGDGVISGSTSA